jgi:hypothetical protein
MAVQFLTQLSVASLLLLLLLLAWCLPTIRITSVN